MPIPLGVLAVAGAGGGAGGAGAYELIETTLLSSAQKQITFSNLNTYSTTYEHLQIRGSIRSNRTASNDDFISIYFNGNGGFSNMRMHYLIGTGSVVASASDNNPYVYNIQAGSTNTNSFTGLLVDILDPYSTNKSKVMRILHGATPVNNIGLYSIGWFDTTAVSSITLNMTQNDFDAKSRISLYGLRSA